MNNEIHNIYVTFVNFSTDVNELQLKVYEQVAVVKVYYNQTFHNGVRNNYGVICDGS